MVYCPLLPRRAVLPGAFPCYLAHGAVVTSLAEEDFRVGEVLFLYDFEFVPFQNPPHTMSRFQEDLRAYFVAQRLNYGMSALGGMVHCRGDIRGTSQPVTE